MITIKGSTAEVVAAITFIKAQSAQNKSKILNLLELTDGGVTVMTLTILSEAEYNAAQRAFVLDLPGRYEGTIDRWKMSSNYGWTTQHAGLGVAEGGKDLMIPREEVAGAAYGNQPIVGLRITYRRERGPKGLRAVDVCMIDNPASVEAFLNDAKSHERRENRRIKDRARRPAPKPYTPKEPYTRAAKDEAAFKGTVVFRPDSK